MRLFPREEKFFELLEQQGNRIVEASQLLHAGVIGGSYLLTNMAGEIKRIEHEADLITHQIFIRLNQTFVTPLDPEDLQRLGAALDDVIDYIEDAAFRLSAYRINPIPNGVADLTDIILQCGQALQRAVGKLRTGEDLKSDCIEINRLENAADDLVRKFVTNLFVEETNAIVLIKHKEIYEVLEATTDRCEDVSDVLASIVVKNS